MHNVLLLGAGQSGSRHLQSLRKSDIPLELSVVDPSEKSLNLVRRRFEELPDNSNIQNISYLRTLKDVPKEIDIAIIATLANVRADVTRDVLKETMVKNILFEKVLFQQLKDYDDIYNLLKEMDIKAWVNCPRRVYSIYQELKKYFSPAGRVSFYFLGGEWGLACNAIHMVDLFAFLTDKIDFEYDISGLDKEVKSSKRNEFMEITGTLKAYQNNGSEVILHSRKDSYVPYLILFMADDFEMVIDETNGVARLSILEKNWNWEQKHFHIPFQSELTHLIVKDILTKSNCGLVTFEDSCKLHLPLIEAVTRHIVKATGKRIRSCPIT